MLANLIDGVGFNIVFNFDSGKWFRPLNDEMWGILSQCIHHSYTVDGVIANVDITSDIQTKQISTSIDFPSGFQ